MKKIEINMTWIESFLGYAAALPSQQVLEHLCKEIYPNHDDKRRCVQRVRDTYFFLRRTRIVYETSRSRAVILLPAVGFMYELYGCSWSKMFIKRLKWSSALYITSFDFIEDIGEFEKELEEALKFFNTVELGALKSLVHNLVDAVRSRNELVKAFYYVDKTIEQYLRNKLKEVREFNDVTIEGIILNLGNILSHAIAQGERLVDTLTSFLVIASLIQRQKMKPQEKPFTTFLEEYSALIRRIHYGEEKPGQKKEFVEKLLTFVYSVRMLLETLARIFENIDEVVEMHRDDKYGDTIRSVVRRVLTLFVVSSLFYSVEPCESLLKILFKHRYRPLLL